MEISNVLRSIIIFLKILQKKNPPIFYYIVQSSPLSLSLSLKHALAEQLRFVLALLFAPRGSF